MEYSDAAKRLKLMVASTSEPKLSDDEIADLLAIARRETDTVNVYTYDLNYAAAEGWLRKAGKASEDFGFMADGQMYNRNQVQAMCMSMEAKYRKRLSLTTKIGTASTSELWPLEI